ncbi:MAG: FAD-dependent oxidoreductase [Clostridia bacterium]|nr:FAD-dependent oxidoreductase [Clostridia bacterium]
MTDILIIGGGIAGLTAALYSLRAGKSALVIEKATFGGQITSSPRVDNYPGLPAVSGNELSDALLSQVLDLGGEIEMEDVSSLRAIDGGFAVAAGKREFTGRAVIVATGARPRPLGIEREDELVGRGVSYCALCDGAFHKGEDVAVVGGGNSAAQAAVELANICRSVTVIQEFDHFTCDRRDLDAMTARPNVRLMPSTKITALLGEDRLAGLSLTNGRTLDVTGLFVAIGRVPDTEAFIPPLAADAQGFFLTDESLATNLPGVWAAGDCRQKTVRQLTTAAADGTIAAVNACRRLG